MEFYRYEALETSNNFPNPEITLIVFDFVKETPKGYWIIRRGWGNYLGEFKKWIPKESKKRYAYPTKKEAMTNYTKRTKYRIALLERQLQFCKMALYKARKEKEKSKL